jgi:hypothetical protein
MWPQPLSRAVIISLLTCSSPFSQLVEQVFENVGEFFDMVNLEDAGGALDSMGGVEDGVESIAILFALHHSPQAFFHGRELLAGFLGKDAVD